MRNRNHHNLRVQVPARSSSIREDVIDEWWTPRYPDRPPPPSSQSRRMQRPRSPRISLVEDIPDSLYLPRVSRFPAARRAIFEEQRLAQEHVEREEQESEQPFQPPLHWLDNVFGSDLPRRQQQILPLRPVASSPTLPRVGRPSTDRPGVLAARELMANIDNDALEELYGQAFASDDVFIRRPPLPNPPLPRLSGSRSETGLRAGEVGGYGPEMRGRRRIRQARSSVIEIPDDESVFDRNDMGYLARTSSPRPQTPPSAPYRTAASRRLASQAAEQERSRRMSDMRDRRVMRERRRAIYHVQNEDEWEIGADGWHRRRQGTTISPIRPNMNDRPASALDQLDSPFPDLFHFNNDGPRQIRWVEDVRAWVGPGHPYYNQPVVDDAVHREVNDTDDPPPVYQEIEIHEVDTGGEALPRYSEIEARPNRTSILRVVGDIEIQWEGGALRARNRRRGVCRRMLRGARGFFRGFVAR